MSSRWPASLSHGRSLAGPAYAIDDDTALPVIDGTVEVVSEGHWRMFRP